MLNPPKIEFIQAFNPEGGWEADILVVNGKILTYAISSTDHTEPFKVGKKLMEILELGDQLLCHSFRMNKQQDEEWDVADITHHVVGGGSNVVSELR